MSTLDMKYIGLAGSSYFLDSQTMDGRFVITGGVCYDLLLNQINNIIPPKLPAQYQVPTYYSNMTTAFVNLELQEVTYPLWENSSASFNKIGRFDFQGNLKSVFFLDRSSGFTATMFAFGYWDGHYHILSRDYGDGYLNYYVFRFGLGNTAVTEKRWGHYANFYGTWNFPKGLAFVHADAYFDAQVETYGSVPEFAPAFTTVGYPASDANIKANVGGVFQGRAVLGLLNSTGNVTLPANGLASIDANDSLPYAIIAGLRFDLQFDPAYAGLIIRGTFFYGPVLYAVLDGNRLFSAIYYPRFSHNFADNFARGVPIAGVKRA